MSKNDIQWISCNKLDLSPECLSVSEKVSKFGYAIVLDEFGSDVWSKAQLVVHDVLEAKDKANILIVCAEDIMHSWYSALVTGLGVDFNFLTSSSKSIMFFSDSISNLYILNDMALAKKDHPVCNLDVSWDLLIIDNTMAEHVDMKYYTENVKYKADKLILFAPVPAKCGENCDGIKSFVKELMADKKKGDGVDKVKFDLSAIEFNLDTPVQKYYSKGFYNEKNTAEIEVIKYKIDESNIPQSKRIDDISNDNPHYVYGGNIFEEYSFDEKRLYTRMDFSLDTVNALKSVDKKLDAFLVKLGEILEDPDTCTIIYFSTTATLEYIRKAICSAYPHIKNDVMVLRGEYFNTNIIMSRFDQEKARKEPRIILGTDDLASSIQQIETITHIINYEIPTSAYILDQRYGRHGRDKHGKIPFIVFADENGMFDSRMMNKVLCGNITDSLITNIPVRNILFGMTNLAAIITKTLFDLKYVNEFTKEVSAAFEVINKFRFDYNQYDRALNGSARVSEKSGIMLDKLAKAFGLSDFIKTAFTEEALAEKISAKLKSFETDLLYLDENGEIQSVKKSELANTDANAAYKKFEADIGKNKYVNGLNTAKKKLDELIGDSKDYVYIKSELSEINDTCKFGVLMNIWRYCRDSKEIYKPFGKFIDMYNEGVI